MQRNKAGNFTATLLVLLTVILTGTAAFSQVTTQSNPTTFTLIYENPDRTNDRVNVTFAIPAGTWTKATWTTTATWTEVDGAGTALNFENQLNRNVGLMLALHGSERLLDGTYTETEVRIREQNVDPSVPTQNIDPALFEWINGAAGGTLNGVATIGCAGVFSRIDVHNLTLTLENPSSGQMAVVKAKMADSKLRQVASD